MKKTIAKGTNTPLVFADTEVGTISIKGVIIPENPAIFFEELDLLINECSSATHSLSIDFDLDYFNTGAARYLYDIFKKLREFKSLTINWHYEADDEDIYESGLEFQELAHTKFTFIQKPEGSN